MASTRLVVALLSIALLAGSMAASALDRREGATWLLAAGSGGGTLWAWLGFARSADGVTMVSPESYFVLATTGLVVTGFLLVRAFEGRPLA